MRVNVYDENGDRLLQQRVDLDDIMGDDIEGRAAAAGELTTIGRYWIGGGAAPAFLLMLAESTTRGR